MATRRQHYVWRNYLRAWAPEDKIYFRTDGRVIGPTNLMNVAQQRDFYKLKELCDKDIEKIIALGIYGTNIELRQTQWNELYIFTRPYILSSSLKSWNIHENEINDITGPMIIETEEKYQGLIEQIGAKYLDLILQKDIRFYYNMEDRAKFLYYLCTQYLRTNKIKQNVLKALKGQSIVDGEQIWNVLSHMYANSLGFNLNRSSKHKMVLLVNSTSRPFITGDQPVVNTYAVNKVLTNPTLELELYYPVSPELAILISAKEEYKNSNQVEITDIDNVKSFNQYIIDESQEQLYSNQREILEEI